MGRARAACDRWLGKYYTGGLSIPCSASGTADDLGNLTVANQAGRFPLILIVFDHGRITHA